MDQQSAHGNPSAVNRRTSTASAAAGGGATSADSEWEVLWAPNHGQRAQHNGVVETAAVLVESQANVASGGAGSAAGAVASGVSDTQVTFF